MKKFLWFAVAFIGCFVIGMATRSFAKSMPMYGFHATLAALPIALLLYLCIKKTESSSVWLQILPVLLFGCLLGMMSPIMAFYNIVAMLAAVGLRFLFKADHAAVLAVGYALLSYPLAVLGGFLFRSASFRFSLGEFAALLAATAVLSAIGVLIGKWLSARIKAFCA